MLAALAVMSVGIGSAGAESSGGIGSGGGGGGTTSEPPPDAVSASYEHLWQKTTPAERRWAHRTSDCESGGNPQAIGGGGIYRGAFQFMRSTWKSSPKTPGGDPITYPYVTQAVVAVYLKRRDGASHWPVCG